MIVRMMNSATRQSEDALHVAGHGRELLDLPEERALQFVAEGLCVVVPPVSLDLEEPAAAPEPGPAESRYPSRG